MKFNSKVEENKIHSFKNNYFEFNRLISIDKLKVDQYSRITFTKKIKKLFPVMPEDDITVYQDRYNKNLIFNIQHNDNVVESWILQKNKNFNNKRNKNDGENISLKDIQHNYRSDFLNLEINKSENNFTNSKSEFRDVPILVVDDDEDILKLFTIFLQSEGYNNIDTFSNSKKALKHITSLDHSYYKLALMDIRMPDINGIKLYQILKILDPIIKVIFLTALDAVDELISIYSDIGPKGILKKPLEQDEFIKAINYNIYH